MTSRIDKRTFKKNIVLSVTAQLISISVGFILNLIVPKFISVEQYGYWQMYVLYVSYVGIAHLGLLDGFLLRYSEYDFDCLNKERIRGQFKFLLSVLSITALLSCICSVSFSDGQTLIVFLFVCVGILSKNIFTYCSYLFQLTNRINGYALIITVQRATFGIIVVALLICKIDDFTYYCLAELIGDIIGCCVASLFNKGLYSGHSESWQSIKLEAKENLFSGGLLMISTWSSMFLVGGARMIINWHWSLETFAQVSLAFTMTHFVLSFVAPVSIVVFPSLKRIDSERLPDIYLKIRSQMSFLLGFCVLFFFPGSWLLNKWLPQYTESIQYLAILTPIIFPSTILGIMTNNYLKAFRREKDMLRISIYTTILGIVGFVICGYWLNSLPLLLIWVIVVLFVKTYVSEMVLKKYVKDVKKWYGIYEGIICVLFVVFAYYFPCFWGGLLFGVVVLFYTLFIKRISRINDTQL